MQTENTAPLDTTTAPAGQADPALQTATPQANGEADAAQGQIDPQTEAPAEGQDDQGTQQDSDQPRDDSGRFKPKIQKRIDELTHARHAAEREAARWRAIAEGRQAPTAPQAHEFATDEAYDTAMRRHEMRQAAREELADTAKATAERYQQEAHAVVADTYNERVQEAAVRIPDFADVVGKADIQISESLRMALMDSERGPDIVYQLAKDPAHAQRLSQMDERQMYRELGRMEAGMTTATPPARAAAPVARTTTAPAPVKPGNVGGAPPNTDPSAMNQAQFEAWARAQGSKHI